MAIVIVDGKEIELSDQQRLNGIQVAALAGVDIPHYCWHPGLSVVASCRMCLVESGRRDPHSGEVSMVPKLVPACQTPAVDGSVFITNSQNVLDARAMVEEDLLLRHPVDCPICDKAGECALQDYHFLHGRDQRRADVKPFHSRRRSLGETVTLFVDRCVMCSRCVRFTREISGSAELMVVNRGAHEEIDVFPGFPLENKLAGNVVDLCPVGALGDKDFLYQQRVWFMKSHDNVCNRCSTGCSIKIDENQDHIYRLKPRENPQVNQWWMCDEGRYGWKHVHDERRVVHPEIWDTQAEQYVDAQWSELAEVVDSRLRGAGRLAAVLSPMIAVEEAYLLAKYIRSLDAQAILALGPVPVAGEDEIFESGFAIHAEKCPNRRGVEAVLAGLSGELIGWPEFLQRIVEEPIEGLWVNGGYIEPWHTQEEAALLSDVSCLIVQDLFPSPLWEQSTLRLPGLAFAEREGSYVNFADRLQSFRWAVRPPAGIQPEGQFFWRLLQRPGLYHAASVLQEVAREMAFFAAASEPAPAHGLDLRVNQLV